MTVVLTLFGVLLYGGSRFALDAFYQSLGTTAEEAGVGYLEIVTHAGISICVNAIRYILLGAITILVMYGLMLLFIGTLKRLRKPAFTYLDYLHERQVEHPPLQVAIVVGSALTIGRAFLEWSAPGAPPPGLPQEISVVVLLVILVGLALLYALLATRPLPDPPPSPPARDPIRDLLSTFRGRLRGFRPTLIISLLLLILVVGTVLNANKQGTLYAAQVKAGYEVESSADAAILFHASCVTLRSTGAGASPASKQFEARKLLYLGQSGGVIVLYQVGVGSVRIPSSSFALQPVSGRCRN
jgi:hypothetical protein